MVDAIITDPPAGIAFMGKAFDDPRTYQSANARIRDRFLDFLTPRLAEALRVTKPGARMLCWAIPRTSHWTATAIEDAGWIIEDRISHIFGQGFPKAKSKLKPAVEDWWLARKPGKGVKPLNIDGCRISATQDDPNARDDKGACGGYEVGMTGKPRGSWDAARGRWPANLCLSHHPECREVGTKRVKSNGRPNCEGRVYEAERMTYGDYGPDAHRSISEPDGLETVAEWSCVEGCPVAELDRQSGTLKSGSAGINGHRRNTGERDTSTGWRFNQDEAGGTLYGDSGGASRFFATFGYFPKASRSDRGSENTHPTVKSTDLMRWLCRLITPPRGKILDPFMGSGSTGKAAIEEGFGFIGAESDPDYFAIAESRIAEVLASTPLLTA